ncbi:MAG: SulP family inorganic anion transporter [Ilumatobacteraceae bacterium]
MRPVRSRIATVLLAGVMQGVLSLVGVARLMRFLPHSVMVGFVDALAILILTAQLPELGARLRRTPIFVARVNSSPHCEPEPATTGNRTGHRRRSGVVISSSQHLPRGRDGFRVPARLDAPR